MKKYIPVDFDEKGNAILGREKNTPTSNGFIPTTWVPGGGGDEDKNGLKSITISPAITTEPPIDSYTIYWDDLTDEEKEIGAVERVISCPSQLSTSIEYTVTLTPTPTWGVDNGQEEFVAGVPVTMTVVPFESGTDVVLQVITGVINAATMAEGFGLELRFIDDDPK